MQWRVVSTQRREWPRVLKAYELGSNQHEVEELGSQHEVVEPGGNQHAAWPLYNSARCGYEQSSGNTIEATLGNPVDSGMAPGACDWYEFKTFYHGIITHTLGSIEELAYFIRAGGPVIEKFGIYRCASA